MPSKPRLQHMDFLWGIRPEAIDAIDSVMATAGPETIKEYMAAIGNQANEDPGYRIQDRIAVILITGTITKGRSFWSFLYGGGNLTRLTQVVQTAVADPNAAAILLDIDSPGGTVSGTEAFSELIYEARQSKPVVAFGNGMMASAAYWIGSAADAVIVEKTADVGSIGVLYVHWDTSKEDEMFGWKRTLITAGEFKGVGNDTEPLSRRDRDVIQTELDTVYDIFIDTVARNRNVTAQIVREDTIREKIIAHVTGVLEDYVFGIIGSPGVHRGRQYFDPDVDPIPIVTVLPGIEEAENTNYGTTSLTMPVSIGTLVAIGERNPSELGEAVLGELITAVFSSIPADAESLFYTGGGIAEYPDEMGQAVLSVGININIQYETDIGDPYNLTT